MTNTNRRPVVVFSLLAGALLLAAGCRPELPLSEASSRGPAPAPASPLSVTLEPETPLDAAKRVLRLHVHADVPLSPEHVKLVRGELHSSQLGQIARDEISQSLAARLVPTLVWIEQDGAIVMAPEAPLEPGETYAVASGEKRLAVFFDVEAESETPLLDRVWPPIDGGAAAFAVYCGARPLRDARIPLSFSPEGPEGVLLRGLAPEGAGARCLRFQANTGPSVGPSVPPPELVLFPGGELVALDPRPLEASREPVPAPEPLACADAEVPFGPGCAEVLSDRLLVRAPEAPLLWGIRGMGLDVVKSTREEKGFVLKGLPSDADIGLDIVMVDGHGAVSRQIFEARTAPPSPHVVLNEVLANPLGPEPHQEWVELYNDGQVDASLLGYKIFDIGGETALPEILLPAGRFALVVNETYVLNDEVDVAPPPDVILVRVPALGKSGLGNAGEPIRLQNEAGRVISRFPALPKPKAGQSLSRVTPDAPDGVSDSFTISEPSPGGPMETPEP